MKKNFFMVVCLMLATAFSSCAQSQSLNGVYVGAELYNTPFNGMQINNIVYYFKGNGTFNDKLDKADWRTATAGTYKISGGMVQLSFKNGDDPKRYKLAANGNLESTSGIKHTLHKVKKVTAVPAGAYESRSASTSGGTGTPMVGAFSSDYLYFDGKGGFSADRSSVVGVGGDAAGGTIGGKFESKKNNTGTYKLGDGEITLTYNDGTSAKHSFFYSPPGEEDLIMVDGQFYFRDEKNPRPVASQRTGSGNNRPQTNGVSTGNGNMMTAATMLAKLRTKYGGEALDKINSIRETADITGGMKAVVITDIANNRVRAEIRQNGKLVLVKQLDGNDGWQWLQGSKKTLTQNEKDELLLNMYQGTTGLHKKLNGSFQSATVAPSDGDYILTFYRGKNKIVYLIGSDYSLKGNAYNIDGSGPNISIYKDFIKKNGITYPSIVESSDGKNKITATTTAVEFNPVLTADDWKTP